MVQQKVGMSTPGRGTSPCKGPVSGELKEHLEDRVVSKGDGNEVREVAGGPDGMGSHQTLLITLKPGRGRSLSPHPYLPIWTLWPWVWTRWLNQDDRDSFRLRVTMTGVAVTGLVVPSRDLGFVV